MTGPPIGTNGPGTASASKPLVDFSRSTAGAGVIRLTIWQVTIARCGMLPVKLPSVALKPGSGAGVGESGVMYRQMVADGSLKNPGFTVSVTTIVELAGASVVVHWKLAKPSAPVAVVAVEPVAPAGRTHAVGGGAVTVAVMSQPAVGWRSSTAGSGLASTILRTMTDGAHSWNAASRSASSSCAKLGSR